MTVTTNQLQNWLKARGIASTEVPGTADHFVTLEIVNEEVWVDFDSTMQIASVESHDENGVNKREVLILINPKEFVAAVVRALVHNTGA